MPRPAALRTHWVGSAPRAVRVAITVSSACCVPGQADRGRIVLVVLAASPRENTAIITSPSTPFLLAAGQGLRRRGGQCNFRQGRPLLSHIFIRRAGRAAEPFVSQNTRRRRQPNRERARRPAPHPRILRPPGRLAPSAPQGAAGFAGRT